MSGDHEHGASRDADKKYLAIALGLLVTFMSVEVVVGIIASSLVLLSDAGHMLSDAGALGAALIAMRLAARSAGGIMTYGLKRSEILAAQINGITLLLLSVWFYYEGVRRLIEPPEVAGGLVLIVGLIGIVVNLVDVWLLSKANRQSLNVEGAFQHILTDLYSFIATTVAGSIIYFTGSFNRVDALAAMTVATVMLRAGYKLVRDSGRIFLEAAPKGLDPEEIGTAMAGQPGVAEVRDFHLWEISSELPALSAHVLVERDGDCRARRRELEQLLEERFDIHHTTLQVDRVGEEEDGEARGMRFPASRGETT
ncbi:Cadmium, cobalt and zinc/H(+)-K(+) antiporter [Rubrobacter xylanophilus DSM 9941]|uniref:Putative cation transporter n=1 Tax=Rubrobacter xylanophilus TaxID=49319 RepID=A0A510HGM6_9ACTN|nr:cation diffusion facilitator family transporter [Rubrobacter xylanophilus]QYJ14849.1 Cadmium, cobalt and zinc/H(+)-K(+) antiporter [Rubrobacter xylanophilus DSM 9941]BBL79068.1 putative cation transporter [Rubrobacter xylanophilus]